MKKKWERFLEYFTLFYQTKENQETNILLEIISFKIYLLLEFTEQSYLENIFFERSKMYTLIKYYLLRKKKILETGIGK